MINDVDFNTLSSEEVIKKIENLEIGDGVITLLSKAEPSATCNIMPTYSDELNEWLGIPNKSEEDLKKLDFYLKKDSNTLVKHGTSFDLKTNTGRAYWDMIKHSPLIAFSIEDAESAPMSMFYVEMPSVENKKTISKERVKNKAVGLILSDTFENLKHRATVFNIADADEYDMEGLQTLLINIAKKDPKRVIEIYASNALSIRLLLEKAKQLNIITEEGGLFKYGIHILGANDEGVIASLSHPDNEFLLKKIKQHHDDLLGERLFTKESVEKNEAKAPISVASPVVDSESGIEEFDGKIASNSPVNEIEWKIGDEYPDNLVQLGKIAINLGGNPLVIKGIRSKKSVIKEIERLIKNKK